MGVREAAWLTLVLGAIDPTDVDAVGAATSSPGPVPAEEKEIVTAYRKAARRLHPDKNRDDSNATEKFQGLIAARDDLLLPFASDLTAAPDSSSWQRCPKCSKGIAPPANSTSCMFRCPGCGCLLRNPNPAPMPKGSPPPLLTEPPSAKLTPGLRHLGPGDVLLDPCSHEDPTQLVVAWRCKSCSAPDVVCCRVQPKLRCFCNCPLKNHPPGGAPPPSPSVPPAEGQRKVGRKATGSEIGGGKGGKGKVKGKGKGTATNLEGASSAGSGDSSLASSPSSSGEIVPKQSKWTGKAPPFSCSTCKCNLFDFHAAKGGWQVKCECTHKHTDHDPRHKGCNLCDCAKFTSFWVCNCGHPWSDHETVFTNTRGRRDQLKFGRAWVCGGIRPEVKAMAAKKRAKWVARGRAPAGASAAAHRAVIVLSTQTGISFGGCTSSLLCYADVQSAFRTLHAGIRQRYDAIPVGILFSEGAAAQAKAEKGHKGGKASSSNSKSGRCKDSGGGGGGSGYSGSGGGGTGTGASRAGRDAGKEQNPALLRRLAYSSTIKKPAKSKTPATSSTRY